MKIVLVYRTFGNYVEIPDDVYAKLEAGGTNGDGIFQDPMPMMEYVSENNIMHECTPEAEVIEELEVLVGPI